MLFIFKLQSYDIFYFSPNFYLHFYYAVKVSKS